MKKPYKHTEKSERRCVKCNGAIKKNVAERKAIDKPLVCFTCYDAAKHNNPLVPSKAAWRLSR